MNKASVSEVERAVRKSRVLGTYDVGVWVYARGWVVAVPEEKRGGGWAGWVRAIPRTTFLPVLGVLLAALLGVFAIFEVVAWIQVVATSVVAAVGLVSEADKLRVSRVENASVRAQEVEETRARERQWQRRVDASLCCWPPPLIANVDPYALGVQPSPKADTFRQEQAQLPPYVPRDVDQLARERWRAQGMLLFVGEAGSGVTRTAFEVASADATPRVMLAPSVAEGLRIAIDECDALSRTARRPPLLVWLDRIDRFSDRDLVPGLLRKCMDHAAGSRVVATISSSAYATWSVERQDLAQMFAEVTLDRLPSERELQLGEAAYPGMDFTEGIAAAFTVTGSLVKRMRSGHHDCPYESAGHDCALARPLVETVFAWTNTGTTRALPVSLLAELLQQRPGLVRYADANHLSAALAWATGRTRERAALVYRDESNDQHKIDEGTGEGTSTIGERIRAHPRMATIWERSAAPADAVWTAAISEALSACDSDAVGKVGFTAHTHEFFETASCAWSELAAIEDPAVAWLTRALSFSNSAHDPRGQKLALEHLLRLQEAALGANHPDVATTLSFLGNAWHDLGEPSRAIDLYERALSINEREYGPDHLHVAVTWVNLGHAWQALGEPARACELFQRALPIQEREYGPDHPEVAPTLTNLGIAWHDLGDPVQARDLHQRVLTIQEREYGSDDLRLAATLTNLGNAWMALGDPAAARDLYERALPIKEREYGPKHSHVARTLANLALAWQELGDPTRARDLHQRALTINERVYGPDHPLVANSLSGLGQAWQDLRDPTRARDMHQRALIIIEREYGHDHRLVAGICISLGHAWHDLEEPARARDLYQRALTINEREYGADHPEVATALAGLGDASAHLGEQARASDYCLRALRIMLVHYPDGHWIIRGIRDLLRTIDPDLVVLADGTTAARRDPPSTA